MPYWKLLDGGMNVALGSDGVASNGYPAHVRRDEPHRADAQAIRETLPEVVRQHCYVHFLRNALDYLPRKVVDDCLAELRWFYDRRDPAEVRPDIAAWLAKWQAKYPQLCDWVEENIEEAPTYHRLPLQHRKQTKSTNMLERLNQEIKRRTRCASPPTPRAVYGWSTRLPRRSARLGWRAPAISTWST